MNATNRYLMIEQLGMTFDTKNGPFTALTNIDLTIEQGEFIALIGHSGCGKSTLLNCIAGLNTPSDGHIILANREIGGPGPDRGVVFQNHSLLPWLTCAENVHLAVERVFAANEPKAQLRDRVNKALALVKLIHAADDARFALLGGTFVGEGALLRFYVLHCVGLPLGIAVLMAVHFWRVRKDGGISGPL